MVQHVWTVLCTRSITDSETNNVSLIEVLEQLTIADPGAAPGVEGLVPMPLELVTLWSRETDDRPARGRGRISFERPSGLVRESVSEHDIDLTVSLRVRHRQRFMGIPIREPGRHVFRVELRDDARQNWATVATVPLEVVFQPGVAAY